MLRIERILCPTTYRVIQLGSCPALVVRSKEGAHE